MDILPAKYILIKTDLRRRARVRGTGRLVHRAELDVHFSPVLRRCADHSHSGALNPQGQVYQDPAAQHRFHRIKQPASHSGKRAAQLHLPDARRLDQHSVHEQKLFDRHFGGEKHQE